MSLATLKSVLEHAERHHSAIAGLVVLGFEDAVAFVEAAERVQMPIILQAGPGSRKHTPVAILGNMFRVLAERASIPVACHLDHAFTVDECRAGLDFGFTSVMIDGSSLPLMQNVNITRQVVDVAQSYQASVEGEVGLVGYSGGIRSALTEVEDARIFGRDSGVDAMAISIGNLHLNAGAAVTIDFARLSDIESVTRLPLVLHGASGISVDDRKTLYTEHRVRKFNIGTELRMVFGQALRQSLLEQPLEFDRLKLLKPTIAPMREATQTILMQLQGRRRT